MLNQFKIINVFFIKFGSRVDLFLPLETTIDVKVNDSVKGGVQKIAHLV